MAPITLGLMTPAQQESWRILLDLHPAFPTGWCLIGGQMVWLLASEARHCRLEGMNIDGIGHRYVSTTYPGPGKVVFDVLAPDNIGDRADLTTSPPARTISAPGTRNALDDTQCIEVVSGDRVGRVLRPSLLAAIIAKAAATTIPVRKIPERDWSDVAFLLCLVPDPVAAAADLTPGQRRALRPIRVLLDESHWAWRPLGERSRLGHATLQFLLNA